MSGNENKCTNRENYQNNVTCTEQNKMVLYDSFHRKKTIYTIMNNPPEQNYFLETNDIF